MKDKYAFSYKLWCCLHGWVPITHFLILILNKIKKKKKENKQLKEGERGKQRSLPCAQGDDLHSSISSLHS